MDALSDPLPLPLQGHRYYLSRQGASRAPDSTVSPQTLGESETRPPRVLTHILESEPLLTGPPRCASASAIASASVSDDVCASEVHAHSLPMHFDVQPPTTPEARPPDGGWGWVIVFAAFMVNFIADSITLTLGMFFPHFLEYCKSLLAVFEKMGDQYCKLQYYSKLTV